VRRTVTAAVVTVLLLGSGCSSSSSGTTSTTADQRNQTQAGAKVRAAPAPASGACDPIDASACLLPWPNNRFTRADPATPTGRRLDLPATGMPANVKGVRIKPGEWNRNDGFAPASNLITHIDGLDVKASKLPAVTDIGRSLDPTSPLVIVDDATGQRVAAWAELDANAKDPRKQALLITPAATLAEGHTFSVGLRNLKRGDGSAIAPSNAFAAELAKPDVAAKATMSALEGHGVKRRDLDLAWSFTVGSTESISGRLRHMWSETATALGKGAPPFTVTSNETNGGVRTVAGTFDMPRYLQGDGGPGSLLNNANSPAGTPHRNGTMADNFLCTVPAGATAAKPSETVIYGHGLLGSRTEVLGIGKVAASAGLTFCALDYLGMSSSDISTVVASFDDLTAFRALPDRLQQGHLGFLLLGRLLRSTDGFAKDRAFQDGDGRPIIDTSHVSLLGASEGGILGGVASSLTNDWTQVVLAVGGLGYNVLLRRSVDFDRFAPLLVANYPDPLEQPLILDLLEQLWQRGENAGYAQHLTRTPYPGVTAKNVLLLEAFGDHQVANVATERLARTLRIARRVPTLAERRSPATDPYFGIAPIAKLPAWGSGLVVWDFGTPAPPVTNQANRAGDDPHGKLSNEPAALALVLSFVRDQRVIDVCQAQPCHSPG
jgi:hypothetical protein